MKFPLRRFAPSLATPPPRPPRHALGRPVAGPDWDVLRAAPEVEVDEDAASGRKVYRGF